MSIRSVAITVGASAFFLNKLYSQRTTQKLPDERLLLSQNHEIYAKEKLTKIDAIPNWGDIYKRLKQDKNSAEKYFIHVLYMTPSRAVLYEVFFNTIQCRWERNGQPLSDGLYTFVITKDWKMLACNTNDEDVFNTMIKEKQLTSKVVFKHTFLTRGEPVFFAGMGTLTNGQFTWNGLSGHYRPKAVHVSLFKSWLVDHGVTESFYLKAEKETIREKLCQEKALID